MNNIKIIQKLGGRKYQKQEQTFMKWKSNIQQKDPTQKKFGFFSFFEKTNKIEKSLVRLIKKKRKKDNTRS